MGGNNAINAGKELPWLRGLILMAPYDSTCYIRKGEESKLHDLMNAGARFLNCDGPDAIYEDIEGHVEEWNFVCAADPLKTQNSAGHVLMGCRIMMIKDVVKFLEDILEK